MIWAIVKYLWDELLLMSIYIKMKTGMTTNSALHIARRISVQIIADLFLCIDWLGRRLSISVLTCRLIVLEMHRANMSCLDVYMCVCPCLYFYACVYAQYWESPYPFLPIIIVISNSPKSDSTRVSFLYWRNCQMIHNHWHHRLDCGSYQSKEIFAKNVRYLRNVMYEWRNA